MGEVPNPKRWWNAKQAAAHLEVCTETILRKARKAVKRYATTKRGMPVIRFHQRGPFRFPIEAFKAWAEHPTD